MNFKSFYLSEMPKIVRGSEDVHSKTEQYWAETDELYKNSKFVKEYNNDYVYKVTTDSHKNINIFCMNPNESSAQKVIGIIQFRKGYPIKKYKYPKLSWVSVHPDFRKKNIATGLYTTAIAHFGGLVSDTSLTKYDTGSGSVNIWKTLAKVNNVYAYDGKLFKSISYHDIEDKEYDNYDILFVVSQMPIKGAIVDD